MGGWNDRHGWISQVDLQGIREGAHEVLRDFDRESLIDPGGPVAQGKVPGPMGRIGRLTKNGWPGKGSA